MSRIRPARFVHVVYRTRRFEQMIDWYRAVFDCKVQYQNPVLAFLTYDDEHHRVALINLSAVKPEADAGERRGTIGVDHDARKLCWRRRVVSNRLTVAETVAEVDEAIGRYRVW